MVALCGFLAASAKKDHMITIHGKKDNYEVECSDNSAFE